MNLNLPSDEAFHWEGHTLFCEGVNLEQAAEQFGTPLYVYSRKAIENAFRSYSDALEGIPHLMCYALKANSNLAVINLLARLGAGFDIVSGGELARVKAAGGDTRKVIFSGVGKTCRDVADALEADIYCFNIESIPELDRIVEVARDTGKQARISLRVNPNVDAKTHPYISTGLKKNKFGVAYEQALGLYERAAEFPEQIKITGIDCHIGSQLTDITPFFDACHKLIDLMNAMREKGIELEHIDFGGGLGIRYDDETPPHASELVSGLRKILVDNGYGNLEMIFEAGRSMVGNAGALIANVEYLKRGEVKNFCIVDAAMNDLIRPTLYQAWMQAVPVTVREGEEVVWDIVGPVCESGDWLAQDRSLNIQPGDKIAVLSAGAYGMSMASNYNTRCRPAEIMVDGDEIHLIRPRESYSDLYATERVLP